jgi:hypothetical protein
MNRLKEILVVVAGVITAMLIMVFAPVAALAQDTVGEDVPPSTPILGDIFTSNSEILFTLLAAAAIPWVVALINQQVWSSLVKQVVAFVTCAVAATGYLVYKDQTVLAFDGLPMASTECTSSRSISCRATPLFSRTVTITEAPFVRGCDETRTMDACDRSIPCRVLLFFNKRRQ